MKKYKNLSILFISVALIISHTMVAVVSRNYANIICWSEHEGFSGNTSIAFIIGIPYLIGLIVCIIFAIIFYKKGRRL